MWVKRTHPYKRKRKISKLTLPEWIAWITSILTLIETIIRIVFGDK